MSTSMEELALEAISLPTELRAELAVRLLRSLEPEELPALSRRWVEEIRRRDAEVREGKVECISAEQVLRRAREQLG